MLPTPQVAHLRRPEFRDAVYDPAEDTFSLMDALEQEKDVLGALTSPLCVEIGSGSGCVSAFLAQIARGAYICTDINPAAAACTAETAAENGCALAPINTYLVDGLRVDGQVDILVFNPPYVPTSDAEEAAEQERASLGGAWAGGPLGTRLIDALISSGTIQVRNANQRLLSPQGRFYLVAIKQNDPEGLCKSLYACGLHAEVRMD